MFLVCVLSFILGVYLEAHGDYSLKAIFTLLFVFTLGVPLAINRRFCLAIILILASFVLCGMLRAKLDEGLHHEIPQTFREIEMEAKVVDRKDNLLIARIKKPNELRGLKVLIRSELKAEEGEYIKGSGSLKRLEFPPTNPHVTSWRFIKFLEGLRYEFCGKVDRIGSENWFIGDLRSSVKRKIETLKLQNYGIVEALTLGIRDHISQETKDLFQRTGTSHILAISGLHMGLISGIVFFILRHLFAVFTRMKLSGDDKKYAAILTIPVILFFTKFFGSSPSTLRASIMVSVYMLSVFFGRERNVISALVASCLIILIINPFDLFSPSFQLSFMSVFFIIFFGERLYPILRTVKNPALKYLLLSFSTTVFATIGVAPITLYYFHGINPVSFIQNLISVPILCGIVTPLLIAGCFLPFGEYLLKFGDYGITLSLSILKFLDFGYIYPFFRPTFTESIIFYALFLSLPHIRFRLGRFFALFILLPTIFLYLIFTYVDRYGEKFCAYFLDLGIGEASLIEAPSGVRILVDAGASYEDFCPGKFIIQPFLLSKKIKKIDYLILSHPHEDHIGGSLHLLRFFRVEHLCLPRDFLRSHNALNLIECALQRGTKLRLLENGDKVKLDENVVLKVFNPQKGVTFEDPNDNSLVFKIGKGEGSFLFTGDITENVEKLLVLQGESLKSKVLKVPHHGSSKSNSTIFLAAVSPEIAIVSPTYTRSLPSLEVLTRYGYLGIPLYETRRSGSVRVCFRSGKLEVKTCR